MVDSDISQEENSMSIELHVKLEQDDRLEDLLCYLDKLGIPSRDIEDLLAQAMAWVRLSSKYNYASRNAMPLASPRLEIDGRPVFAPNSDGIAEKHQGEANPVPSSNSAKL
jgi:hypothetical protein